MRVAVVSDIHGNLQALEAVLASIDRDAPDEIWCLGDLVGYGPRPNRCCALVAERADVCLIGNHDLAALG
ncbi:MAG TPA: metallophosphoesterase family protein, partial [Gaiellaceae bacterium]|nr:metallophosphoesterase family protein [Gaiellaceae bacterium]